MKLPRDLSGAELIKVLCRDFGYQRLNQEGSDVIVQTEAATIIAFQFRITIPSGLELSTLS